MASLSVYGYNSEMLTPDHPPHHHEPPTPQPPTTPQDPEPVTNRCQLLELPLEIRAQIYSSMLPRTVPSPKGLAWDRAAPIWATNRQIYTECIGSLYGASTFLLDIGYDHVDFLYQYRLPRSDLVAKRLLRFPERMAARNRALMRRFEVRIQEVDGYGGMVKYDCGNPEVLAWGVREQVRKVCRVLGGLREVRELRVVYGGKGGGGELVERLVVMVLEPFWELRNVRGVEVEMRGFGDEGVRECIRGQVRECLSRRAECVEVSS